MAMTSYLPLLIVVGAVAGAGSASRTEPTHSSFCALVGTDWKVLKDVITESDVYASDHALKRGTPSPNGIVYAGPNKQFIIKITPVGPRGVEVAFFPRVPDTFVHEASQFEDFVMNTLAPRFSAVRCEDATDYGKGQIYGYDNIAI